MYINIYVYQTVHNMYSKFSDILPVQRIEVTQSTTYVNTSPTNWSHPKHNICECENKTYVNHVCTSVMIMCVRIWWCVYELDDVCAILRICKHTHFVAPAQFL
jgi:hypothetical protein